MKSFPSQLMIHVWMTKVLEDILVGTTNKAQAQAKQDLQPKCLN